MGSGIQGAKERDRGQPGLWSGTLGVEAWLRAHATGLEPRTQAPGQWIWAEGCNQNKRTGEAEAQIEVQGLKAKCCVGTERLPPISNIYETWAWLQGRKEAMNVAHKRNGTLRDG